MTDKAAPELNLAAHNRLAIQIQAQRWLDARGLECDISEELNDARLIITDLLKIAYRTPIDAGNYSHLEWSWSKRASRTDVLGRLSTFTRNETN